MEVEIAPILCIILCSVILGNTMADEAGYKGNRKKKIEAVIILMAFLSFMYIFICNVTNVEV